MSTPPPGSSSTCFARLEPKPEKKMANCLTGKAKGILERFTDEKLLRVEWSTSTIYYKAEGGRSQHLVSHFRGNWQISEDVLALATNNECSKDFFLDEVAR